MCGLAVLPVLAPWAPLFAWAVAVLAAGRVYVGVPARPLASGGTAANQRGSSSGPRVEVDVDSPATEAREPRAEVDVDSPATKAREAQADAGEVS